MNKKIILFSILIIIIIIVIIIQNGKSKKIYFSENKIDNTIKNSSFSYEFDNMSGLYVIYDENNQVVKTVYSEYEAEMYKDFNFIETPPDSEEPQRSDIDY